MGDTGFSMSRAFDDATRLFREPTVPYVLIALIFAIPTELLNIFVGIEDAGPAILAILVGALFSAVAEAAITVGALRQASDQGSDEASGKDLMAGALVTEGMQYFVPVLIAVLIISVLAAIGIMLLIIPGIIVMALAFFAIPVIIAEKTGALAGLDRSMALGAGSRLEIFMMVFLFMVVLLGIPMMLDWLLSGAPVFAGVLTWVVEGVVSAYGVVLAVTAYLQLVAAKSEG